MKNCKLVAKIMLLIDWDALINQIYHHYLLNNM